MGLNEDEPQLMSLEIKSNRSRRVAGVMMKADVCVADNRQPTQSPAGVGVAGTSGRATTDKAGRVEPMSQEQSQAQSEAQAGSTGEAANVGSAVGGVRSSDELNWLDLWAMNPETAPGVGVVGWWGGAGGLGRPKIGA